MKHIYFSALLLFAIGLCPQANAQTATQIIDLESALADLTLKLAYNAHNTLATPKYQRRQTTSAYIPLNENISTHMAVGYAPANLARKDDQWSSTIGLTFTHRFTYKPDKPQQADNLSTRR